MRKGVENSKWLTTHTLRTPSTNRNPDPNPTPPCSLAKVIRVRVQPQHEQGGWVELEDSLHLEILEMADPSLSLSEMVEEFVEERLSQQEEEDEEEDYAAMVDDEEIAAWENTSEEDVIEGEEEEEVDEEEQERRAVEAVTNDVLRGLRSLYFKRLIEFVVHD